MGKQAANQVMKRRVIGNMIVGGPRALFPSPVIDDFGWLEPQLLLLWHRGNWSVSESIILFCDDTMNRNRNFLQPVLRHAVWHRSQDLKSDSSWPEVTVRLGFVRHWNATKRIGRRIQSALLHPPLIPYGHSKTRRVPVTTEAPEGDEYRVFTRNGVQYLEFASHVLSEDPLAQVLLKATDGLLSQMEAIDPKDWRERYDYDLPTLAPQRPWDWTVGQGFIEDWEPIG